MYAVAAVQVIMAAIDDSDGTRRGVQRAVFSGSGVRVSARTSVLGKTLKIDPATGDVNLKDFTALVIRSGTESFYKVISLA
jgi:branched-chain amino acid transport system substrate-binding protein